MTIPKKIIKLLTAIEILILFAALISFEFYINLQVASLSSFLVIVGSAYAYKKMVHDEVESQNYSKIRDPFEELEDPYELYDETPINEASADELDLKAIVKEEKKKIKILNFAEMKKGSRAGVSLFRLIPYLFLILGFIALKNNGVLDIAIYLPSLLVGILTGSFVSKNGSFTR